MTIHPALVTYVAAAVVVVSGYLTTVIFAFEVRLAPKGGMCRVRNPPTALAALHEDPGAPQSSPPGEPTLPPIYSGLTAPSSRRRAGHHTLVALVTMATAAAVQPPSKAAAADDGSNMFAPGFVQQYSDFEVGAGGGYSYRDVTLGRDDGNGPAAAKGDRVVYDWSGYTIGYFGRPFQAKGGPQGGAFDKDLDYSRAVLGSGTIVKGLEAAMVGMRPGGVRQVIIPYGDLSYPADDPSHDRVGPKPSTFSGDRALNFVLENPRLDRTLLFNIKVIRVDKPNGRGGFNRG